MEPTGIGVIGAGLMGAHFLAIAQQHPACLPVGVADVLEDRAHTLAVQHGVRSFSDYRDLLADPNLDAVVIATGEASHLEPALDAAAAGKHMLIEKPLATSSMDAEKMVEAATRAGVLLMVAHALRFDPNYGRAWQAVRSGSLGEVVHVNARRNTSMGDATRLAGRVSVTFYLGSHSVDVLQWIMGSPICEVTAICARKALGHLDIDDTVLSLLRFQNGAIGALENSWIRPDGAANRKIGSSLVLMGTRGAFAIETMTPGAVLYTEGRSDPYNPAYSFEDALFGIVSVYRDEFGHFVDCIRRGARPIVTPAQALSTVRVCEAIEEALRLRRPVSIAQDNAFR